MTYREEPDIATLSPNKKHCYACANILDVRAELCPKCGVRQPMIPGAMTAMVLAQPVALATTSRSRMSAALLAFFLGGLGIHKFYLGRSAAGVAYLLFCWTMVPSLIAFVESIMLFGMSDSEFARRYPD